LPETAQYHLFVTFALDHRSGALLPVLDLLARRGINGHSIVGKGRSANTFLIEMELEGADPVVLGQVLQDLLKIESLQEIRRYHW
jgi:(p)ppGpp synthase/HD superfamily hydrolase